MLYQSELPEIMKCGRGVRRELGSLLPGGTVFVICGKHASAQLHAEQKLLFGDRPVCFFDAIPAEVPLPAVEEARLRAQECKACSIVGIGGGSAMDAAKAVASLFHFSGSAADAFYNREKPEPRRIFLAALPTTAGTGAEVTANAVLADPETGIKQSLRAPGMTPDAALADSELLYSSPRHVAAASGFDALTQALESFLSLRATSATQLQALSAAKLLLGALPRACAGEKEAWDDMALGSMLTGIAFSASGLGAVHGIGHPAGSVCHVPHGVCCAVLLPLVLHWNLGAARPLMTSLAHGVGFPTPEKLIEHIVALRGSLELPSSFKNYGLTKEAYPFIVANCRSGSMKCNPRKLSDEDVIQILEALS